MGATVAEELVELVEVAATLVLVLETTIGALEVIRGALDVYLTALLELVDEVEAGAATEVLLVLAFTTELVEELELELELAALLTLVLLEAGQPWAAEAMEEVEAAWAETEEELTELELPPQKG